MNDPFCDICLMRHDRCEKCGALVVASLTLHRTVNAHGNGPHWCGPENPRYQAMLRATREEIDGARELLTECPTCRDDVIRRANSPVLYDVHGFYGLLGETAVHNCATAPLPSAVPVSPPAREAEPVTAAKPWRVIP